MADAYIGEIRIFGFNFAPRNWAFCSGQTLSISQNTALFSILGVQFGGNGTSTFGLPNFNATSPMHQGTGAGLSSYAVGQTSGTAAVTLSLQELPQHIHTLVGGVVTPASAAQQTEVPSATAQFSLSQPGLAYATVVTPPVNFNPAALGVIGGGQPHENRQPYLVLNFCICVNGVFPTRN